MLSFQVDRIAEDGQGIGEFVDFTMIEGEAQALATMIRHCDGPAWQAEVCVAGKWEGNQGQFFVMGLPPGYALSVGQLVDVAAGPALPAPPADPAYRGIATVSAFTSPVRLLGLVQAGYKVRFREDDRIPGAQLHISRGEIRFGSDSEYPAAGGWESFADTLDGASAALRSVVQRLYSWRQLKAFGQNGLTDAIAWPEYHELVKRAHGEDLILDGAFDGFAGVIERMAHFARFEMAEDAFMRRHELRWLGDSHRWAAAEGVAHA